MGWIAVTNPFDRAQIDQFWHAIQECRVILGASAPFPQAHEWDTFTVETVTDHGAYFTVADTTKDWTFAGGTLLRWTQATPGLNSIPEFAPTLYDVVIDADRAAQPELSEPDWRQVVRGQVTGQTSTTIDVGRNLARFISERGISAAADLVGRTGWVIRRDGQDWTRGPINWPNARVYCSGVVAASAAGTLTNDRPLTQVGSLVGMEVVYEGAPPTDPLQRGTVLTAVATTGVLTFSGTTVAATVGRRFYVVPAGGYFQFGRAGGPPLAAHAGPVAAYATHTRMPSDGVGGVGLPATTVDVRYGQDSGSCPAFASPVTIRGDEDGLDVDYEVPYDNVCGDGDYFVSPKWWQCWRSIQNAAYRLAPQFVLPDSDAWNGAPHIYPFTYATWLHYAGVNALDGTAGTHSGTTVPCALGVGSSTDPVNLWWSIIDDDARPMLSGYHQEYDGATLSHPLITAAHDGKAVVASTGYDRVCERVFDLFYAVTRFIPSLDIDGNPVVPPTDAYPGTFERIDPPTHYTVARHDGSQGRGTYDRHLIQNGHRARYIGHRAADPGFPITAAYDALDPDPLLAYHNNAYVGRRADARQSAIEASRSGVATSGSAVRVVDASRDWDAIDFPPATNGRTHAFTPSVGSTTSCTVPGVDPSGLWSNGRFPDGVPFKDFCVEFVMSGTGFADPAAVIEKRIIATGADTGAITWVEPLSATANGKAGRIVEPMVPNPSKGRSISLVPPGGAPVVTTIVGSHGDTLFVADPGGGYATAANTAYAIHEPRVGDVFERVAGAWVNVADGAGAADPRFGGGAVFLRESAANRPDWYSEKGFVLPGDITFGTSVPYAQLKATICVLRAFIVGGAWDNPGSNNRDASWHLVSNIGGVPAVYTDWSTRVIGGDAVNEPSNTGYYNYNGPNSLAGAPYAHWLSTSQWVWTGSAWSLTAGYGGRVDRQFNRWRVTPPQTPFPKTIFFYANSERFGSAASAGAPNFSVSTAAYDNEGDPLAEGVYVQWDDQTVTTGDALSIPLGSLAVPNDAGDPDDSELPAGSAAGNSGNVNHRRGYTVTDAVAIAFVDKVFACPSGETSWDEWMFFE
jgi:hypothetical protein